MTLSKSETLSEIKLQQLKVSRQCGIRQELEKNAFPAEDAAWMLKRPVATNAEIALKEPNALIFKKPLQLKTCRSRDVPRNRRLH